MALVDRGPPEGLHERLLPVPGLPRKMASSCCAMKRPVASSWIRCAIPLLNAKSKLLSERTGSRKRACLCRYGPAAGPAARPLADEGREEVERGEPLGL